MAGSACLPLMRLKEFVLLQGPLKLAQMPAQIPTLVQVRWVGRTPGGRHYRIGLEYVI